MFTATFAARFLSVSYVIIISALFYAPIVSALTSPAGTRPETEADLPAMRAAGIPNPTVGMLWNPRDPLVGQSTAEAKRYLLSIARALPGSAAPPTQERIAKLNDVF